MADLMTDAYEYESLQKKYKNFTTPALKFKIGGTDVVQKKEVRILSAEVTLSLNSAGSARIVLGSCYDYKNGSFEKSVKDLAVLGKEVEVSLGYVSSFQKVFKGFLASVEMTLDADEGITAEFTALDVRWLMMTDNFRCREHAVKNYSDAVQDIMKRYKKLCSVKIDATKENFEDGSISQRASDYDFIIKDLIQSGRTDREFFVVADKAYFRKPRSVSQPIMTLSVGGGLVRFSRKASYENQKITVMGYDPVSGKRVEGTAASKAMDRQTDVLGGPGERLVTDLSCTSSAQAKERAETLAAAFLARRQKADAVCVGLPEIIPGRFLRLSRVDSVMNQKYYITQVTHTLDSEGFFTSFTMEGWE